MCKHFEYKNRFLKNKRENISQMFFHYSNFKTIMPRHDLQKNIKLLMQSLKKFFNICQSPAIFIKVVL